MQWLQIISAFGIGALCIKLLDILWLQRVLQKHEHQTWLRNKRLESYTSLANILISLGLYGAEVGDPFAQFAVASEAMLLTDDDALVDRIDQFIVKLERYDRLSDKPNAQDDKEVDKLYNDLTKEARQIMTALRNNILGEDRNQQLSFVDKMVSWFRRNS